MDSRRLINIGFTKRVSNVFCGFLSKHADVKHVPIQDACLWKKDHHITNLNSIFVLSLELLYGFRWTMFDNVVFNAGYN